MDLLGTEVAGWRAIRYQQRCLSPSATGGPFTVERHVADAVAVLDGLGVDRAVVAGHSWGGHLALQLAVAHPDRVAGLLIIDSPGANGDVAHLAVAGYFAQPETAPAIPPGTGVRGGDRSRVGPLPWHEQPGCVAGALSRIRGLAGDLESAG
jgi:pimeloyl-ACP methyl ester carboxylesterase